MIKNYIKIAVRNLRKHKAYSLINLLGLSIGLAVAILILLYVRDELEFDTFHQASDRIYRLIETQTTPEGERRFAITVAPLGPTMVAEIPGVEDFTRLIRLGRLTIRHEEKRYYEEFLAADASFFKLFDFKFVQGDPSTALADPLTAVLTKTASKKYFGEANPIGKTLETDRGMDFEIIGVIQDPPQNSHLKFEVLMSLATLQANERFRPYFDRWDAEGFTTYILLSKASNMNEVAEQITALLTANQPDNYDVQKRITLQPLRDIHFHSAGIEEDRNAGKSEMAYIYVLAAIALFIVLIACINYMNLATARSANRTGEIGLRKVVGAQRKQLIAQFMTESLIMSFAALLLALVVVQNVLPFFNTFAAKDLSIDIAGNTPLILALLLLATVVGVVSGSYPALFLSKTQIMQTLKRSAHASFNGSWLRRILVVTQFALSVVLIIATLAAFAQMRFIQNKRLGFNQDHLIVIDINSGGVRSSFAAMKTELARGPEVRNVSVTSRVPGEWKNIVTLDVVPQGLPETASRSMKFIGVDQDFLATFEVDLADGRNFDSKMATDTSAVLLNQAAVANFGWDDPLGKTFRVPGKEYEAHVIGVVKNFHFRSLHEKIEPLILGHSHNPIQNIDYFSLRIGGAHISRTLAYLQQVHQEFDKVTPFEYHFLDQQIDNFYKKDQRVSQFFAVAAGLAILIACLGLFGLAAFTAEQRTKEIGIRKVLGARVWQLAFLLSKDFTQLVAIAFLIASPIAYYCVGRWLESFAYYTPIGVSLFIVAGLIAFFIALLTVAYQAIKTALANPVDSLRYE